MSDLVAMIVRLSPKPGKVEALRTALQSLLAPTRSEPGCLAYNLHESDGPDGTFFVFYEIWRSQEDHKRHDEAPWISAFLSTADSHLDGPVKVERLRIISALSDALPS